MAQGMRTPVCARASVHTPHSCLQSTPLLQAAHTTITGSACASVHTPHSCLRTYLFLDVDLILFFLARRGCARPVHCRRRGTWNAAPSTMRSRALFAAPLAAFRFQRGRRPKVAKQRHGQKQSCCGGAGSSSIMSTMFHTITPDGTCTPSASPAASPMLRGGGGGGGGGDARAGSSHPFDGASSSDLRALAVGGSPSARPSISASPTARPHPRNGHAVGDADIEPIWNDVVDGPRTGRSSRHCSSRDSSTSLGSSRTPGEM